MLEKQWQKQLLNPKIAKLLFSKVKNVSWWYGKHFNIRGIIPDSPRALLLSFRAAALTSSSVGL